MLIKVASPPVKALFRCFSAGQLRDGLPLERRCFPFVVVLSVAFRTYSNTHTFTGIISTHTNIPRVMSRVAECVLDMLCILLLRCAHNTHVEILEPSSIRK